MKPPADRAANHWAIDWPWIDLQKCLLPIEPGELVILAARPSVGKSSLARQLAWSCVDAGIPTLFHTLEVGDSELATNLAANISGRQARRDLDRMHPSDQAELLAAYDALAAPSAPFQAIGEDDTCLALISRARAFKSRHGMRLWVVDHLGLIADCMETRKGENVATAIGRVTRALKRFATTERVAVLLLCQLNRGAEGRDGPPLLSHLRDSGRIEEDANRVIFLHRPTEYHSNGVRYEQDPYSSPSDERTHYIEVIQAKGRNTGTSTVALSFDRPTSTFKNFLGK
jgi:replicative DNA helicase